MAKSKVRKAGKKNRKWGRNKAWCESYRARDQRGRNKVKKLLRHIKRYGATDHMAVHCFNNLPARVAHTNLPAITPVKSKAKRIQMGKAAE